MNNYVPTFDQFLNESSFNDNHPLMTQFTFAASSMKDGELKSALNTIGNYLDSKRISSNEFVINPKDTPSFSSPEEESNFKELVKQKISYFASVKPNPSKPKNKIGIWVKSDGGITIGKYDDVSGMLIHTPPKKSEEVKADDFVETFSKLI